MTNEHTAPAVYAAINEVSRLIIEAGGVGKERRNQQQGYSFRGIDDVLNVVSPAMVKAGLICVPQVVERTEERQETKSGGIMFRVLLKMIFSFHSIADGSSIAVPMQGEGMDTSDKATNKAISQAMKYTCITLFGIPTNVPDADEETPEPAAIQKAITHKAQPPAQFQQDVDDLYGKPKAEAPAPAESGAPKVTDKPANGEAGKSPVIGDELIITNKNQLLMFLRAHTTHYQHANHILAAMRKLDAKWDFPSATELNEWRAAAQYLLDRVEQKEATNAG